MKKLLLKLKLIWKIVISKEFEKVIMPKPSDKPNFIVETKHTQPFYFKVDITKEFEYYQNDKNNFEMFSAKEFGLMLHKQGVIKFDIEKFENRIFLKSTIVLIFD